MTDKFSNFQSLPEDYQQLIQLIQKKYQVTIKPLQLLVGGRSGAAVFLVSVRDNETQSVEHCIMKLDHKGRPEKADEWARHSMVLEKSPQSFSQNHVTELVFDRVEYDNALGIFYRIAGQSLLNYLPLSKFSQQAQLEKLFTETNKVLLSDWNSPPTFQQGIQPRNVLDTWLGFRLDPGGKIESFIKSHCQCDPNIPGFLINSVVYPNPLYYARSDKAWGEHRPIDVLTGMIHGDLNTNNILAKLSKQNAIDGYYLIDFALFKDNHPLLYDQRYLEFSYLLLNLSNASLRDTIYLLTMIADGDDFDPQKAPISLIGSASVISAAHSAFSNWVEKEYPSLIDDLWGQYLLAGTASGLSFTHKAALSDEQRLAGLIYSAANLKRFLQLFNLPLPTEASLLYDQNQTTASPPGKRQKVPAHNLPVQPTPFIGRSTEIDDIKSLLMDPAVHLVTLIGPGGTGKTRLSIRAAEKVLDQFPDGVYFVPLADDTEENQLISRIAKQLNVREGGRPLLENIKDFLMDKQLLLVLDNFEQLLLAAPRLSEILNAAPDVKILTSSRIGLNLQGEHIYEVPPLKVPDHEDEPEIDNLLENDAIRLFIDRAVTVQSTFKLTPENAPAVMAICRRLDGLPLAIELAAARTKLLSPQEILQRIDQKLKLLTGGARDLPARHQTIRNTLDWSYDLLNNDDQILFARLSVFSGGFSLQAVEATCNDDNHLDILEGLSTLVNHSLIRKESAGNGESRFVMLEVIREFAYEQLLDEGELETYQKNHAQHFGEIVRTKIGDELFTSNALHWLDWADQELNNIRAALSWSLSPDGDIKIGVDIVNGLIWFWYRRGLLLEGLMWAERLLASPDLQAPSIFRAMMLHSAGLLAIWTGEQDKGLQQLEEAVSFLLRTENDVLIAYGLMSKAVALINMGKDSPARSLLEQAGDIFKGAKLSYFQAITLVHLGNVELGLGNPDKAFIVLSEAETIARSLNENWLLSFVINNLGEVARTQGKFKQARSHYEQCLALLQETGDRGDMARFVHSLGYIAFHENDFDLAESHFRRGLTLFRQLGNRRGIAECLAGLAGIKAQQGAHQWGATLLSASESLLKSTGGAWWPADRIEVENNLEYIQKALSEEDFSQAWQTGSTFTLDQAIQFAVNESDQQV